MPSKPDKTRRHSKTRPPIELAGYLARGDSFVFISTLVGADQETIARWARLPEIKQAVADLQQRADDEAIRILSAAKTKAAKALVDVLERESKDKDIIKAAEAILDRTGLPKTKEISQTVQLGTVSEKTDEELEAIIARVH